MCQHRCMKACQACQERLTIRCLCTTAACLCTKGQVELKRYFSFSDFWVLSTCDSFCGFWGPAAGQQTERDTVSVVLRRLMIEHTRANRGQCACQGTKYVFLFFSCISPSHQLICSRRWTSRVSMLKLERVTAGTR